LLSDPKITDPKITGPKKNLYERLGFIASDIEKAIISDDFDFDDLSPLVAEHDDIMTSLSQSGFETDASMNDTICDAEKKIRGLISTIQAMQTDIQNQLSAMNKKRLIQSKYLSEEMR
jgi:hypothetical protein